MAEIAIVKGETPAGDRTWLTLPDGTARRVPIHVAHDLPHFAVESRFGIEDGLWGVLARGGFSGASRAVTARHRRLRLVTDEPLDELGARNWPGHLVAKAAVNAVVNLWREGPDTPAAVRARMRSVWMAAGAEDMGDRLRELAARLDDNTIAGAIADVRRLCAEWSALQPGDTLRLHWPC